jgi:hypothetical protein
MILPAIDENKLNPKKGSDEKFRSLFSVLTMAGIYL